MLIEYKHTLALYHKIREDLNKIGFIITIIVQIFLLFYYSYSIYVHHTSIIYTILYSILLIISLLVFIEECLFQYKQNKEKNEALKTSHKKKRVVLKIISLVSKVSLLILSVIPIIQNKASDFNKIITLALAILLVFQFSFLFISFQLNKYMTWLKKSIELDLRDSKLKSPNKLFTDKLHKFAIELKNENEDAEFLSVVNGQLEEVEKDRKIKKQKDKEKRKQQRSEDFKTIKNHFKDKYISKKISDGKVIESYKKELQTTKQLISDSKKYNKFIDEINKEVQKNKFPEELNYLNDYLSSVKDENLPNNEKEMMTLELHYYLHPLVSNSLSVDDNLKIHIINQEKVE